MFLGRSRLRERWDAVNGLRLFSRASSVAPVNDHPPVVLVHGLGVSSRYMVPLALALAPSYRVFAPDLPGFGQSERPPSVPGVRALAFWLKAWMEVVGVRDAVVIGNSMGCQIIAELADIEPATIRAAALLGPTMDDSAGAVAHVLRLLQDQFHEPLPLVPLQAFDYLKNGPLRTALTFRQALRHKMAERIACLTAPTLIMRGTSDPIVSQQWVERLAARLPNGRLITVRDAGHAVNYNSPHHVTQEVKQLIESELT